jgi:hypothetical protein
MAMSKGWKKLLSGMEKIKMNQEPKSWLPDQFQKILLEETTGARLIKSVYGVNGDSPILALKGDVIESIERIAIVNQLYADITLLAYLEREDLSCLVKDTNSMDISDSGFIVHNHIEHKILAKEYLFKSAVEKCSEQLSSTESDSVFLLDKASLTLKDYSVDMEKSTICYTGSIDAYLAKLL